MRQLPQMNELYEKYNGKGLHIIGLYAQDHSIDEVRALVKDNNIKYPQALAWVDEDNQWSMPSLPMVWVIGVDGNVKYVGAKGYEKALQDQLSKVKSPGLADLEVAPELKEAAASFAASDYGKAWKLADAVAGNADASEAALECAAAIKSKVDERFRTLRNKAEVAEVENDWRLCVATWQQIAAQFTGYEDAAEAKEKNEKLKADKKVQLELEAATAIRVIDRELNAKTAALDEWIKRYKEFAAKYKETSWHEKVNSAIERMEEEQKAAEEEKKKAGGK
ncbi:hypothetical protein PLCT2_01634 [Planctomycetaceae bacterium]|nr:hypothetical protein PLCT2_01634 [Planctomycetaceae bacterium]